MPETTPALPTAIRVGPHIYTVHALDTGMDNLGVTDADNLTISLDSSRPVSALRATLLHEVLHTVHHAAGIRSSDKDKLTAEEFVTCCEVGLLGVLRDNPDLVAYLTAQ